MNTSSLNSNNDKSIISFNDIIPPINIDNSKVLFFPKFLSCLVYDKHSIIIVDLISKTIAVKFSFPKESISHVKIIDSNTIAYVKHLSSYDQIIVTNLKCLDEFCELKIKEKVYDYIFNLNETNNYIFYILTNEETFLIYNDNVLITTFQFGSLLMNIFIDLSFSLIDSIQLFHIEQDINLIFILFKNGIYFILTTKNDNVDISYNQNSFGQYNEMRLVKCDKFEYYCKEEKSNLNCFLLIMNYIDSNNNYKHLISGFKINKNEDFFNLGNIEGDYFVADSFRYSNDSLDKHFLYCMCINNNANNYVVKLYDILEFLLENEDESNQNKNILYKEVNIPIITEISSTVGISGVSLVPSYGNDIKKDNDNYYSEYISFDIITKEIQNNCFFMQITIDISQQNDDVVTDVDKFITYCNNQDIYTIKQNLLQKWKEKDINIQIYENDPWEKMYLIYLIYCGNIFSIKKYLWLKDTNSIDIYLVSTQIIENTYKHMHNIIKEHIKTQHITKETHHYIKLLLEIARILQHRTCTPNKKPFNSEQALLNEASIINSNRIFELENFLFITKILHEQNNFIPLDLDNITYLKMFSLVDNKFELKSYSDFIEKFFEMTSLSDDSSLVVVPLYKTQFYTKFVLFLYFYVLVKKENSSINESKTFAFCNCEYKQYHLICDIIFNLDKNIKYGKKVDITDTDILAFLSLFIKILENVPILRMEDSMSGVNADFMVKLVKLPFLFIKELGENGYKNEAFYLGYGIEPYIMDEEMKKTLMNLINSFNMLPCFSDLK